MFLVGISYGLPIEQVLAKQGVKRKNLIVLNTLRCVVIMHFHKLTNNVKISNVLVFQLIGITHMLLLTQTMRYAQIRVFGEMAKKVISIKVQNQFIDVLSETAPQLGRNRVP